jgi:hypothetical protein
LAALLIFLAVYLVLAIGHSPAFDDFWLLRLIFLAMIPIVDSAQLN